MLTAIVNPLNQIAYSSFYIYALEETLGRNNVRFSVRPFRNLSNNALKSPGVLFILRMDEQVVKKYYIYSGDTWKIDEELYEWCDIYASTNANIEKTPGREKLISLVPSFGLKCWNTKETVLKAISNAAHYISYRPDKRLKTFLGNYKRLLNRPSYDQMKYEPSRDDYIFFCSTLWYNDEWNQNDIKVNARRANFIRACKRMESIDFEGGFVEQKGRSSVQLFNDCMSLRGYPYSLWLQKTKQSAVVFNTPAFWDCHGWKLGEYLSLGKAIISSPLSNDLPAPLKHGINIHFVEDCSIETISKAIHFILTHPEYKHRLESGAREYWEEYGSPTKCMILLGINK